jgi:hypothetical protein
MIRKGQACCSVGLLHHFILGLLRRRTKMPIIIYPDLRLDYKVATHPFNVLWWRC